MPSTSTSPLSLHDALPIFAVTAASSCRSESSLRRFRSTLSCESIWSTLLRLCGAVSSCWWSVAISPSSTVTFACRDCEREAARDRKSTRLNSSHLGISYAVHLDLPSFPTRRSSDLRRHGGLVLPVRELSQAVPQHAQLRIHLVDLAEALRCRLQLLVERGDLALEHGHLRLQGLRA